MRLALSFITLVTVTAALANPLRRRVRGAGCANSTVLEETPETRQQNDRKWVVAHHMVGNTFPYTKQDWRDDIVLAQASGIDGFVLNTGKETWEPARVADAYQAALESGLDFKLFLSLDMESLNFDQACQTVAGGQAIRDRVTPFLGHPNQLNINGKAVISTFSGQQCTFGQGNVFNGWRTQFTQHASLNGRINFIPSFFIDPATFGQYTGIMNGDFNWNGGWPLEVTTAFAQSQPPQSQPSNINNPLQRAITSRIGSRNSDIININGLQALGPDALFMGAVSPWFFTHYSPQTWNKNWVYVADQHLYNKRWESLIQFRNDYDIAQVLTWNDYGESHYIGPVKGGIPNSQAWTDNMPHTAWLDLTRYYATAFKTGSYPAVQKDQIFVWSRPHARDASSPDSVARPANYEVLEDAVWVTVLTTAPASVTLATTPANSQTFQVPAGHSKLSISIAPGGTIRVIIARNGANVVTLTPNFTFTNTPPSYNFNVLVASARAP
ncbi:glycoside hydrolase [Coprinopsis marcescibilis]|uniref:Glycoside hydrolase n=1 Tax=Coprinopsis marcescibilis TaxID=230819 RepID=A0A5C3KWR2_COPMA|nr:glycoside hydrolase [Coprinopsis marcescibilis]